uniref:Uncharacterized protein n=1 Tax=Rhizophora mucronata TaxID=61149 RepID=A0A2P2Q8M4_RHIMU
MERLLRSLGVPMRRSGWMLN